MVRGMGRKVDMVEGALKNQKVPVGNPGLGLVGNFLSALLRKLLAELAGIPGGERSRTSDGRPGCKTA